LRREFYAQAKKEQLKKEGKLLTPKQKAERAAAEARRAALLASGNVTIAGLAEKESASTGEKKVSYGKKEKKQPPAHVKKPVIQQAPAPVPAKKVEEKKEVVEAKKEESEEEKDSWDVSSSEDEGEKKTAKVEEEAKDDWDASSSEDEEKVEKKSQAKCAFLVCLFPLSFPSRLISFSTRQRTASPPPLPLPARKLLPLLKPPYLRRARARLPLPSPPLRKTTPTTPTPVPTTATLTLTPSRRTTTVSRLRSVNSPSARRRRRSVGWRRTHRRWRRGTRTT
jgi:hypothetical protein